MKNKILNLISSIISFSIFLTSCSTSNPVYVRKAQIYSIGVDYSEFAEVGFFITESNSVSFEYETIGSVSSYVQSGGRDGSMTVFSAKDVASDRVVLMSPRDAVKKLYDEAIAMGANGIINLKMRRVVDPVTFLNDGYEATGMAIKK